MRTTQHTDPMHFRRYGSCRTNCKLCRPPRKLREEHVTHPVAA